MDRKTVTLRELAGFLLLGVLLLAGLLSSWYMGRQHDQLAKTLDSCTWMALSGQWSNARQTAAQAQSRWEKNLNLRAALADHTPMEEIDDLFAEISVWAAAGERTEFARSCAALSKRMEAMGNAHRLSWQNIL